MADPVALDHVVVTARLKSVTAFELPASITMIRLDGDANRPQAGLSETLDGVPGLLARDRQNYAQDTQLSIRGFGARAMFGVRGLRLYSDGIPATMPDGQGQISHFNLQAADRVEVMRGPFSALYGNSSGGVIQLWSADGTEPGELRAQGSVGRYDSYSLGARLLGAHDAIDYNIAAALFDTQGYRRHSAAQRRSGNVKIGFDTGHDGRLTLIANAFDSPRAQDPLGLTREQVRDDPRQASPSALQYDTRKTIRQNQMGLRFEQSFAGGHALNLMSYAGGRNVTQYLSVPVAAQRNPLHAGGISDLDNDYGGIDARWSWQGELGGRPLEITAGGNVDKQRQHRRGFENFVGDRLGVRGALRRDERDDIRNFDQYAQAWWRFAPRWSLLTGIRHSQVRFRSRDRYITAANPDDSGRVRYTRTTPVASLGFAVSDDLRLYLSSGRGFETPTFNELSYRTDGNAGLAFDLRPAASRNWEFGGKWHGTDGLRFEAALFRADTDDELAVATSAGGRASYRNVGRARRQGFEAMLSAPLGDAWNLQLAYTWLDATFRDTFPACAGSGCDDPSQRITVGTRIPGTAKHALFGRLQWRRASWEAALETSVLSRISANDRGSATAAGHVLMHLESARTWYLRNGRLRGFVRVENLFGRAYIGSIIVNEGNGRYYEPGPDRTVLIGAQWQGTR